MIISLIVAADEENGIGRNNQLPWHLPADLKYFKALTTGHTIIMGRKTFDSIGKPLPNRRNIVVTRQTELHIEGTETVSSLDEAYERCKTEDEIFVIGGAQIFVQALAKAHRLYLTIVHGKFDADTFLPEIDPATWVEEHRDHHQPDEKNRHAYTFIKYRKA